MRTCPNCGREVGEQLVCANCGTFVPIVDDEPEDDGFIGELGFPAAVDSTSEGVKTWRVVAFVVATCALAIATAIVLLSQGSAHKREVALPLESSSAPVVPLPGSSFAVPSLTTPAATSSLASSSASHSKSASASPTASKTARTSSSPVQSSTPTRTSSAPHTSPPPSSSSSAPRPSVTLARGAAVHELLCNRHCFQLVVTLSGFPPGPHDIDCVANGQTFDSYTTSMTTSTDCVFGQTHDRVWVMVDGLYQSNVVIW